LPAKRFLRIGPQESFVNAEGILQRLIQEFPSFLYNISPVIWVTLAEDSDLGKWLVQRLSIDESLGWIPCGGLTKVSKFVMPSKKVKRCLRLSINF
jgi:hypothetical protein